MALQLCFCRRPRLVLLWVDPIRICLSSLVFIFWSALGKTFSC